MLDLSLRVGFGVAVDPRSGRLELGPGLVAEDDVARELDAARDAYADPPAAAPILYHMLNGITPLGREEPGSALRYELTSLRPGCVGTEWVKTVGHLHNQAPDGLGYPEVYDVVAGCATFVLFRLQKPAVCVLVDCVEGEGLVIPPGWHHLALNPGDATMVFADVVPRAVMPDYSLLRERRGAPVRVGPGGVWPNLTYGELRVVRLRGRDLPQPERHVPLARAFLGDRPTLDYLLRPAGYVAIWRRFEAVVDAAPALSLEGGAQ